MAATADPSQAASSLPEALRESVEWERNRWCKTAACEDPFYDSSAYTGEEVPGSLLKLEKTVDTALRSLPPATALSRFVYQSQTFNGTPVPVSACILWPLSPRSSSDGYRVVAWAHGTTGIGPNYAPSNMKDLGNHFIGPFSLALQGYVVVATDYAGLGISKTASGRPILHEYLAHGAHANDVVFSIQAAKTGFPELSKHFVVAGYSQGGGIAWSLAERHAISPIEGYLGAVAVCPITRVLEYEEPLRSAIIAAITPTMESVLSKFDRTQILTDAGVRRLALAYKAGASLITLLSLLREEGLVLVDATSNERVQEFQNLTSPGRKRIAGPLLVMQGQNDQMVNPWVTDAAVQETVAMFPDLPLEYVRLPGVGHNSAMFSAQWVWMDWIADRFAWRKIAQNQPQIRELEPAMAVEAYHPAQNWWVAPAIKFHQTH